MPICIGMTGSFFSVFTDFPDFSDFLPHPPIQQKENGENNAGYTVCGHEGKVYAA